MTLEEKVDEILGKLNEKKSRDSWDKAQISATVSLGILTLLLAIANLWITSSISTQAQAQADKIHQDQILEQKNEQIRKERDELFCSCLRSAKNQR